MDHSPIPPAVAPTGLVDRFRASAIRHRFGLLISGFTALLVLALMWPMVVFNVPAGHVGVLWKRFDGGTVLDRHFREGIHFIAPWNRFVLYDTRLKVAIEEIQVLSSDGLTFRVTLAWRYRLQPEHVPSLHRYVGADFERVLLSPTITGLARDVIAVHPPEEIYTEKRLGIADRIERSAEFQLRHRFNQGGMSGVAWINLEDVLIKDMILPEGVQMAIVRKNAAFHEMEEWSFRILREQKEADRKRTEALGIRQFQEIVSNGMSDSYLRWRGIEATVDLAKSPNSKVVVVGSGRDGLPLILNAEGRPGADSGEVSDPVPRPKAPAPIGGSRPNVP